MSIKKYLTRLKRMDNFIRHKATGTPTEFAQKLELSKSTLMDELHALRDMGLPIAYDYCRQSYYYEKKGRLAIKFDEENLSEEESRELMGGRKLFSGFSPSPVILDWENRY